MNVKRIFKYLFILLITGISLFSCRKPDKTAPLLPESESVTIDLSFFQTDTGETVYKYAYEKVSYWQVLLNDSLHFQHTIFFSLIDKEPVYQSDQTWLITEHMNDLEYDSIIADFFMTDYSDSVKYQVYFSNFISAETFSYLNLLLYDGMSYSDNTYGYWMINKPDTSNTYKNFLMINWGDTTSNQYRIKFTNRLEGNDKGSFLLYRDSTLDEYNSYLDLYDKGIENHTYIHWNSGSNKGKIRDEFHFNDTLWRHWNEFFEDETVQ